MELIRKPGWDNLMLDALSRQEELIIYRLFMLIEDEFDEVKKLLKHERRS